MAEASHKEQLLQYIKDAPIYFASTHGAYDLRDEEPEPFTVPPNTYIFEAASVGESTYTIIDKPLWQLIQNRDYLASYIKSESPASDSASTKTLMRNTLRNLHVYKPGDVIYKRLLMFKDENEFNNAWGYYKFLPEVSNIPFPASPNKKAGKLILAPPLPSPPSDPYLEQLKKNHFYVEKVQHTRGGPLRHINIGEDKEDYSNNDFIKDIKIVYDGPSIFVFSSCASFWVSKSPTEEQQERAILIARVQQERDQEYANLGFTSGPATQDVNDSTRVIQEHRNMPSRSAKKTSGVEEVFANTGKVPSKLIFTAADKAELRFLKRIGDKPVESVSSRFPVEQLPAGATSIFTKEGEAYRIKQSPSKTMWWTKEEIELYKKTNPGDILYYSTGSEFKEYKPGSTGGTRRFLKKSKRTCKNRFRKTL